MRKRTFSTLFYSVILLAAAACSKSNQSAASGQAKPFHVALLTPGPISDQSWNAGAYAGLMRIKDSLGAQVSHIETKTPAEFEENFRQYGAQGYDLVFGHGFEFQDAARRVAPTYPHTIFVTTSGNTAGPNLAGMEFAFADPSYLAGMLAGAMTRSNLIGMIGGTELPPVKESFSAFERGARRVNPKVKVITSYIGNWDDVSAGKEQALAQLTRGVDVIFQNADAAGIGIFQAVKQAKGAYIFGSNSDQNSVAPDVTVGSVVINLPHAFLTLARKVKAGGYHGSVETLGMRDDVVTLVLNPVVRGRIPVAALAAMDSVRQQMLRGAFSAVDTSKVQ